MKMVRRIGYILTGASFLYLIYVGISNIDSFPRPIATSNNVLLFFVAFLLYMTTTIAGGIAWHIWLKMAGITHRLQSAIAILLASQVAKYLPGGLAHHLARLSLASRSNIPAAETLGTIFMESCWTIFTAMITAIGIALLIESDGGVFQFPMAKVGVAGLIAFALFLLFFWLLRDAASGRISAFLKNRFTVRLSFPGLAFCFALYLYAFIVCAIVLRLLMMVMGLSPAPDIFYLIMVFSVAWTGGFVAFAAPAGMGVREAILTLALSPFMGEAQALNLALGLRVLSVGADMVSALIGTFLLKKADRIPAERLQETKT